MTRKVLIKGLMMLQKAGLPNLRHSPDLDDKATVDVWLTLLKGMPDKDFMRAAIICAQTCEFFPTPAKIRAVAIPPGVLTGGDAWLMVEREITRCCGAPGVMPEITDPVIIQVVTSMGGLNRIWERKDRSFVSSEFIRRYNEIVSSERRRLLVGTKKTKEIT